MPADDRGRPPARPPEPKPTSLKHLGLPAQRAFGRLEKALRAARIPAMTQIEFADALREAGFKRYGVDDLWDTREVRRLDDGGVSLKTEVVWTVIEALGADPLDAGLLLQVAGMNGVYWAVHQIQQQRDHPLFREALGQRVAEPEIAQAVLDYLPPVPQSASLAPIFSSADLFADAVTLEAARQIFRGLLLPVLTAHVDCLRRAAGLDAVRAPAAHTTPATPAAPTASTPSRLPSKTQPIPGR